MSMEMYTEDEIDPSKWIPKSYTAERRLAYLFNVALYQMGKEIYARFSDEDIFNASLTLWEMITHDGDGISCAMMGFAYEEDEWEGIDDIADFVNTAHEAAFSGDEKALESYAQTLIAQSSQNLSLDKILGFLVHYSAEPITVFPLTASTTTITAPTALPVPSSKTASTIPPCQITEN